MRDNQPQPFTRRKSPPAGRPLVIDGEAVVVQRRTSDRAPPRDAGTAERESLHEALNAARADRAFGRRPTRARAMPRDLVFQQRAALFGAHPAGALDALRATGLALFPMPARGSASVPQAARLAFAAACFLALPVIAFLALGGPYFGPADADGTDPLILAELSHRIEPHGGGAVLTVDGVIFNRSAEAAAVPPLRIALAGPDGGINAKSFTASVPRLSSGASLRFHSAVAVARGTRGEVEVGFVSKAAAGPDIR